MTLSPSQPPVKPLYTWAEIWTAVLTRPSVQTFQEILRDPAVSRRRAYTWIAISWVLAVLVIIALLPINPEEILAQLPPDADIPLSGLSTMIRLNMLCMMPIVLLIGVGMIRLIAWVVQFIAYRLGADRKNESGTQMIYCLAAIQAPLNILSLLTLALPANGIVEVVSLVATFYQWFLMIVAVRAVYNLSWGRAIVPIASIVSILLLTLIGLGVMM
jgi:hypothetical protein